MNWRRLVDICQANAWPAMVDDLAGQLGVTSASLFKLGIGYLPRIQFKNNVSYRGWWCIPERNAQGQLTGIGLRTREGEKLMYPGSKHGLIYAPDEHHLEGGTFHLSGVHTWVRIYEVQPRAIDCPLCHKPDGCMVAREDPHNPWKVMCIRVSEGAVRQTKLGWEHHLKPPLGGCPLPLSEQPILIVEGMSDAAAGMDMGFVTIGRPSNVGGLDLLPNLLRGRKVIIVGENDDAGIGGMNATFQALKGVASKVTKVLPSDDVKDLREWATRYEFTAETFLQTVQNRGSDELDADVLESRSPVYIAKKFLKMEHSEQDLITLRKYHKKWFKYNGYKYKEVAEEDTVRSGLYKFLDNRLCLMPDRNGVPQPIPYEANRNKVSDVIDALTQDCPITTDPPCWLNRQAEPDPHDLIVFRNGMLNVKAYLEGNDSLIPTDPNLFTLCALPYDYDPDAKCPLWYDWRHEVLDADEIRLLQQWYAYCMTTDTSLEKLMLFYGPTRSGKSTALEVLRALVGQKQVASPSLSSLGRQFGKAALIGKLVAIISDARLSAHSDSLSILETLLNISGCDSVEIDRKHLPSIEDYKLSCRFTIATNELPSLPDHAHALEARLNVIKFGTSFRGREDFTLKARLPKEAPGIAVWALQSLKDLYQNGFHVPESMTDSIRKFRKIASPTSEFVDECCLVDEEQIITAVELFDCWARWAREHGLRPSVRSRFEQRLMSTQASVSIIDSEVNQRQVVSYQGIGLRDQSRSYYLGG